MKKIVAFAFVISAVLAMEAPRPVKAQGKVTSRLMVEKLKNSQRLLEGIATGDFGKITASAEELIQLSKTEEWLVFKTPRYEMNSNEFRRAAELLIQKAKSKNIDGTTLAFFEMTMSCVRCHQYVREVRDARLPPREGNTPLNALYASFGQEGMKHSTTPTRAWQVPIGMEVGTP